MMVISNTHVLELKKNLEEKFEIKDLGDLKCFVGIQVERDREKRRMKLHQTDYISRVLEKFNMENAVPKSTPMETGLKLLLREEEIDVPYRRSLVGSLWYLVVATRPISHIR